MRRLVPIALLVAIVSSSAAAQQPTATTSSLSLGEALNQANRNSPTYRQVTNDATAARWAVRSAYSNAILPTVSVNGGLTYTGAGASTFGGSVFNQSSPTLSSGYGIGLDMTVSGTTLTAPGQQKAAQNAITEDINNAEVDLKYQITFQYLTVLQAIRQAEVARQQVSRNGEFLALAEARYQVGQATIIDVKQAQVLKGQADVSLLRAEQAESEGKLELYRRMGIQAPLDVKGVVLSDSFPVASPPWQVGELLAVATEQNPTIRAARARENSAHYNVRAQQARFLPSLNLSADWNGYTQQFTNQNVLLGRELASAQGQANNCEFQNNLIRSLPGGGIGGTPGSGVIADCKGFANLDATGTNLQTGYRDQIVRANNVFPFSFTSQPFRASLQVSLPIFDGFTRNVQVSQARAQRDDLREALRGRQLQVRTEVQSRFIAMETSFRAIAVQLANREAARDQLRLSQDRYRLGSGSALDVTDAQNNVQKAEGDYVTSVYDYHKAVAALELAVGRPLR